MISITLQMNQQPHTCQLTKVLSDQEEG